MKRILIACEYSGVVRDAFTAIGWDAWSCDILPSDTPGQHIQDDVLKYLDYGWDMMIAHPPCTYLTVTGNKWFKPEFKDRFPTREQDRKEAIDFFLQIANANIDKICIENPVGVMSTVWKKPTQYIQPYFFGHKESKKTGLWLKNLPPLAPTDIVEPEYVICQGKKYSPTHYAAAGKNSLERSSIRSKTYQGIADAMAAQWGIEL